MPKIAKYYFVALALLMLAVTAFSAQLFDGISPQEQNSEQSQDSAMPRIKAQQNEVDLLARAVHAESRGEPYEGQVAVASVILNRVEHPEFPNTIAGVVYEPLAFQVVANGQIDQPASEQAIEAANEALYGMDPTNGALYFYNPNKTRNQWIRGRPVVRTIGKHLFAT